MGIFINRAHCGPFSFTYGAQSGPFFIQRAKSVGQSAYCGVLSYLWGQCGTLSHSRGTLCGIIFVQVHCMGYYYIQVAQCGGITQRLHLTLHCLLRVHSVWQYSIQSQGLHVPLCRRLKKILVFFLQNGASHLFYYSGLLKHQSH